MLAGVELGDAYRLRVDSLIDLIDHFDREVEHFGAVVADVVGGHHGYLAILAILGVGPVLAAVFVAEIGDVARFGGAPQLCSWAGLTRPHES